MGSGVRSYRTLVEGRNTLVVQGAELSARLNSLRDETSIMKWPPKVLIEVSI
jgi:hypothetical protein